MIERLNRIRAQFNHARPHRLLAYYAIGWQALRSNRRKLAELKRKGLPRLPRRYLRHGGGGIISDQAGLAIGGSGGGGGVWRADDSRLLSGGGGGQGTVELGNEIEIRPGLSLYPLLSIGGGGQGVVVGERDPDAPERLTRDPEKRTALGGGGVSWQIGALITFRIGGRVGLVIGAQVGIGLPLPGTRQFRPVFLRPLIGIDIKLPSDDRL